MGVEVDLLVAVVVLHQQALAFEPDLHDVVGAVVDSPVTASGLASGSRVTAWVTTSVCTPLVLDHAASSAPFISRSRPRA